jgi:GT2 family glycosyltransferase
VSDEPVAAAADPPPEVTTLADRRAAARENRDFAAADALRAAIAAAGWLVTDTPHGYALAPAPPFVLAPNLAALPDRPVEPGRVAGVVLVNGWPQDVEAFVSAWAEHTAVELCALDLGDVDGAGSVLHGLAQQHPGRVLDLHVSQSEQQAGWGPAVNAAVRASGADVVVLADLSSVLDGDAVTPLVAALSEDGVAAAGWRGVDVNRDDAWRSFDPAGPGEVDAVLGYLLAVRRDAFDGVGGVVPKARFYRNADIELSLLLREAGGRVVVPVADLPVHQERHRGYHDSDPAVRDRESRRTYERILQRFRGRDDLLAPRR